MGSLYRLFFPLIPLQLRNLWLCLFNVIRCLVLLWEFIHTMKSLFNGWKSLLSCSKLLYLLLFWLIWLLAHIHILDLSREIMVVPRLTSLYTQLIFYLLLTSIHSCDSSSQPAHQTFIKVIEINLRWNNGSTRKIPEERWRKTCSRCQKAPDSSFN